MREPEILALGHLKAIKLNLIKKRSSQTGKTWVCSVYNTEHTIRSVLKKQVLTLIVDLCTVLKALKT